MFVPDVHGDGAGCPRPWLWELWTEAGWHSSVTGKAGSKGTRARMAGSIGQCFTGSICGFPSLLMEGGKMLKQAQEYYQ